MDQQKFNLKFLGTDVSCVYIKDRSVAASALAKLATQNVLFGVDIETYPKKKYVDYPKAGLSPHLAEIRLLQIYNGKSIVVFDLLFIDCNQMFIPFLESKRFLAHNAVFELQFLRKMGCQTLNIGCTMLLAKMIFHAARATDAGLSASLENVADGFLGVKVLKGSQTSDWSVPNLTYEQVEYAAIDAIVVVKVAEELVKGLDKFGLQDYYQLVKESQYPVVEMQLNGIRINKELHKKMVHTWRPRLIRAQNRLKKVTGLDKITAHTIATWLCENLSTDMLRVWPQTPTGKLKTDAMTMADFDFLDIVKPFSAFQKWKKLATTYGLSMSGMVNPDTDRLHPGIRLCGARTGRMSCVSPNLQNMPRDKEFRSIFIPREGHVFLRADYSQIEVRIAAELSRDEVMLDAYRTGGDLYKLIASKIVKKPVSKITDDERQKGKACQLGFMFGLGASKYTHYAKKNYGVVLQEDEGFEHIELWRQTYPGYHRWQMAAAEKAAVELCTTTPTGKYRCLQRGNTFGTAMNNPIQGAASEVMEHGMIKVHNSIKDQDLSSRLIITVHDELVVEAPLSEAEGMAELMARDMIAGFVEVFPEGITKGLVEVGIGKNWSDAKV